MSDTDSSENVESCEGGGQQNARKLGVPVDLLHLLLTLVDEQQLRGNPRRDHAPFFFPGCVRLHGEVPLDDLVVFPGGGEDGGLVGVPVHRGDRRGVVFEGGRRLTPGCGAVWLKGCVCVCVCVWYRNGITVNYL